MAENERQCTKRRFPEEYPYLLRVEDLAEVLGVSRATLYRWLARGGALPPSRRLGGRRVWARPHVVRWLLDRTA
jgi:excisionase family DNA binding protein